MRVRSPLLMPAISESSSLRFGAQTWREMPNRAPCFNRWLCVQYIFSASNRNGSLVLLYRIC